jgi:BRCT domain type II-containing protein
VSSDGEDSEQAPLKKAAVAKLSKGPAKNVAQSNGKANPLSGMAIVFTGDFEWERERLVDATKKHGG